MLCRLIVVLRNQVHVFTFPNKPQRLFTFETRDNPKGKLIDKCQLIISHNDHMICIHNVKLNG